MYRIPDDFEPSVFVDRELENLSFGPYTVHFNFGSVQVTLQGTVVHESSDGWADEATVPLTSSRLMQLVGHKVTRCVVVDSSSLRLDFEHGHALTLIDDTPDHYESFQIETEKKYWVI